MKAFSKVFWSYSSSDYILVSWIFLRGLALIYFSAFASMAIQIDGLVGANGILPVVSKLALVEQFYAEQKFWYLPTIFWVNASDFMLKLVCYAGMGAACLLLLNIFTRTSLILCYFLYLSVVVVGQDFTRFQWDAFLLETGFLAIFLTWGSGIIVFLFRWLLARFMFMGGVVKIASGDPSWANLTALNFHYETQPLPSPIAYYVHHLPEWFHKICVGGVFVIELVVPFFIFLPKCFRIFACYSFIMLQTGIILTGNYTFFNMLTILLCLFLLEDRDLANILPKRLISLIQQKKSEPGRVANTFAGLWAGLVMLICVSQIWIYHVSMPTFQPLRFMLRAISTYSLVNNYGPFSVMTTKRNEIIVQSSNDGRHWLDYHFKYKPGKLNRELSWNIPHQPRLDWQMWFAALSSPHQGSWFDKLLIKIQQGSPQVLALLDENPFPDKPPRYIRAMKYHYSYNSQGNRDTTGQLWRRQGGRIYWLIRRENV